MDKNSLDFALETLGNYLQDKNLKFEIVVIGGGSLLLLGSIIRPTKDLDVLALRSKDKLISSRPLPDSLMQAIKIVGRSLKLPENWINTAPADLWEMGLPEGFYERLTPLKYGSLTLLCAGRYDQICFKLYATVDQGPNSKHFEDLKLLKPTRQELDEAGDWCRTHDVSFVFAENLKEAIKLVGDSNE